MGFWWFWKALASPNTVSIPWSAVAVPLVWTSTKMSMKMMMTHRILSIFKDSRSFGPKVGKHVGIGGCYLKVLVVWVVLCFVSFNLWGDVVWGAFKPSGSRYISCCVLSFAVFFWWDGQKKTHSHTHTLGRSRYIKTVTCSIMDRHFPWYQPRNERFILVPCASSLKSPWVVKLMGGKKAERLMTSRSKSHKKHRSVIFWGVYKLYL